MLKEEGLLFALRLDFSEGDIHVVGSTVLAKGFRIFEPSFYVLAGGRSVVFFSGKTCESVFVQAHFKGFLKDGTKIESGFVFVLNNILYNFLIYLLGFRLRNP